MSTTIREYGVQTSPKVAEIFFFLLFSMVLLGSGWDPLVFLVFLVFPKGFTIEQRAYVRMHHCSHVSWSHNILDRPGYLGLYIHTPHTLYSVLHILCSSLEMPSSIHCIPHSMLYTLCPTTYVLWPPLYVLYSILYTLYSSFYIPYSSIYKLYLL